MKNTLGQYSFPDNKRFNAYQTDDGTRHVMIEVVQTHDSGEEFDAEFEIVMEWDGSIGVSIVGRDGHEAGTWKINAENIDHSIAMLRWACGLARAELAKKGFAIPDAKRPGK